MRAQEKIKVFISSSMSTNEDGHDWLIFRKELADQIDNSSILTPFRIEEYGSLIPSEQYYLTKIEQTDIVVALVYGELRPGTENEIRYAIELNKPVLFLKVGDKENQSIRDIVSFLHIKDYCTTVAVDSFTDLTQEVVDYIEDTIVTLFHGRLFEITKKRVSGVGVSRLGEVAIPTDVIDSFGLSQIRLLERIGYYLDWLEPKSADPCLEALGNAIVDWAVDGEPLDLSQYKELMFSAMRESGCHKQILEHRYNAMGLYLQDRYKEALAEIELARVHVSNKDSWIYGNILIDKRNLSTNTKNGDAADYLATQEEIDASNKPVVFPLASKYECNAMRELEKSRGSKRTHKAGSISVDNRIAIALKDVSLYMFVAALYGSIASLMHSRILLARILLGYSDVFESPRLTYEGLRVCLLSGDSSNFTKELDSRFDSLSNNISSEADALWCLSGRVASEVKPSIRCALIGKCGAYFSDEVIEASIRYLTEDKSIFLPCWDNWAKAINFIKLRMAPNELTRLMIEILSGRLFVSSNTVGSIIGGYALSEADEESRLQLASTMRDNQEELIKGGMSLSTFAVVEAATGETILRPDNEYSQVEMAAYQATLRPSDKRVFLKECFLELEQQVNLNNTRGVYSLFGNNVVTPICNLIQESGSIYLDAECIDILGRILNAIIDYQGALPVVGGVLEVCFAVKCNQSELGTQAIDRSLQGFSVEGIRANSISLDSYSLDVLECYLMALNVTMDKSSATKYLSKGVQFQQLSYKAKIAYTTTFAQLVKMNYISDAHSDFASAVALAVGKEDESAIRKRAVRCIVECVSRWGSQYFRNSLFGFARDPSDEVRYALLGCCMNNSLEEQSLSNELLEVLSNDVNWFIRWHAAHDERS